MLMVASLATAGSVLVFAGTPHGQSLLRPRVVQLTSEVRQVDGQEQATVDIKVVNSWINPIVVTLSADCCSRAPLQVHRVAGFSSTTVTLPIEWRTVSIVEDRLGVAVHLTDSGQVETRTMWYTVVREMS
jgi:hypothetical protein